MSLQHYLLLSQTCLAKRIMACSIFNTRVLMVMSLMDHNWTLAPHQMHNRYCQGKGAAILSEQQEIKN